VIDLAVYDDAPRPTRPWVMANMVSGVDGSAAVGGRTKELSSEDDRALFHHLRTLADVILVGAATVRDEHYGPHRPRDGSDPRPIAVVTNTVQLDLGSSFFTEAVAKPVILTSEAAPADGVARATWLTCASSVAIASTCRAPCTSSEASSSARVVPRCSPTSCATTASTSCASPSHLSPAATPLGSCPIHSPGTWCVSRSPRWSRVTVMSTSGTSGPTEDLRGTEAFHHLLADLDPPVLVVTCGDGATRSGCLVGFATQCSIRPPRFLVCISRKNHTYDAAMAAAVVAVHLLDDEDADVAQIFGELTGDDVDKLALVPWIDGPAGVPVLATSAGWFAGTVVDRVELGDHTGLVLEPIAGEKRRPVHQLGYQAVKDLDPGHAP
jgi:flavin reductase (DIM6/NTAB) family NADH-FMN oxidoreductase RutF